MLCRVPFVEVGFSYIRTLLPVAWLPEVLLCYYQCSGSSQIQAAEKEWDAQWTMSDVPAAPINTAVGGKASLQPKRTPVSEREIDAILVSNFFFFVHYALFLAEVGSVLKL